MAIVARAAVAVGFQERGALAPEQRHVRFGRRRGDVEVAGQHGLHARRRHFRIAGELVEQATQDHGIGMGDRVLDDRVVRCPQFRPGRHLLLGHALAIPPRLILARLTGVPQMNSQFGHLGGRLTAI